MPKNNVVMLYRDSNGKSKIYDNTPNSFCANIHDLFNDNFFFNNCDGICTIGEFAQKHIKDIKEDFHKYDIFFRDCILTNNTSGKNNVFYQKLTELHNKILLISEPVIRKSLLKEFMERYGYILYDNSAKLMSDYIELKHKYDKLQKELNEKNKPER